MLEPVLADQIGRRLCQDGVYRRLVATSPPGIDPVRPFRGGSRHVHAGTVEPRGILDVETGVPEGLRFKPLHGECADPVDGNARWFTRCGGQIVRERPADLRPGHAAVLGADRQYLACAARDAEVSRLDGVTGHPGQGQGPGGEHQGRAGRPQRPAPVRVPPQARREHQRDSREPVLEHGLGQDQQAQGDAAQDAGCDPGVPPRLRGQGRMDQQEQPREEARSGHGKDERRQQQAPSAADHHRRRPASRQDEGHEECDSHHHAHQKERPAPDALAYRGGLFAFRVFDALPGRHRRELGRGRENRGQGQGVGRLPARIRPHILYRTGIVEHSVAGEVERDALVLVAVESPRRPEVGHRPRQRDRAQGERRRGRRGAGPFRGADVHRSRSSRIGLAPLDLRIDHQPDRPHRADAPCDSSPRRFSPSARHVPLERAGRAGLRRRRTPRRETGCPGSCG